MTGRLVSRDDVQEMLLDRVRTLRAEEDSCPSEKAVRQAQLALLGEMLVIDFPALKDVACDRSSV